MTISLLAPVDLSSILVHVSLSVNVAESRLRTALRLCGERRNLRRTVPIALVVGAVLTLINQGDVFLDGGSTALTWVKLGLNFCVPFIVSNIGLVTGSHGSTREGPGDP